MRLEFVVPIFDCFYIGENRFLNDMWTDKNFHNKIKDYEIDSKSKIILRKFEYSEISNQMEIDVFSKLDNRDLYQPSSAFYFECEKKEFDDYTEKLYLLMLSFRIIKKNDASIKYIICKTSPIESLVLSYNWKYAIAEQKQKHEPLTTINKWDLDDITEGYLQLQELFKLSPRTTHAINFLFLAYTTYYWMESYILFVTALETLVSPPDENQITKRILNRTVKLINNSTVCSKSKLNKLYELRSNITHGRIIITLDFKDHLIDLQNINKIILEVFNIILKKDFKSIYFSETSKENFFNNLENNNHNKFIKSIIAIIRKLVCQ